MTEPSAAAWARFGMLAVIAERELEDARNAEAAAAVLAAA
ncbi:hypothetical protein BKA24_001653 [Microbacterium marinum]|uniref:Uncharacterized protein n=1 Tax=Microbacterium marinum TaxID=421115 RepID=A0A7W7BQG9_9MICO|nr:hypothetical protein [Microbacterium marinum]